MSETTDESCIFCSIVADEAERSVVYEDDSVMAFMDILPVNAGHLLVVPKRHATYLADLDPEDGAALMRVAQRCATALRESDLPTDGINLFLADGVAAGQEVFHVHLHVLPRHHGDDFRLEIQYPAPPTRATLDTQAATLAASLRG